MERNFINGEFAQDYFTGKHRRRSSDSTSEGSSPSHIELHRIRNTVSTKSLYRESRRRPSSSSYHSISTENVEHQRHHRRSNAVAIPINQFLSPSRPEHLRSRSNSPLKPIKVCRHDCQARRQALQDPLIRTPLAPATPDGTHTPARSYRSTKPSRPDAYSFYQRASRSFCAETHENGMIFEPRICSYILLQHSCDDSSIEVTQQEMMGSDLVVELKKPRSSKQHCELRVVVSPEHNYVPDEANELDKQYHHTRSPFPFDSATWETLFEVCEFHKAFFDSPKANIVRQASVDMNGIQSFYLGLHDSKKSSIKVFVSHKQFERVTTVFIHDCSGDEKHYILDRLEDAALQTLTVHPLLILTIVLELLHDKMWKHVEEIYRDSLTTIREAQATKTEKKRLDADPESIRALTLGHSTSEHLWHMDQLRDFATHLKEWIEDFGSRRAPDDQAPFNNPKDILLGRVDDLEDSLREAHNQLKQAERYVSLYKQWLDAHIANAAISLNLQISKSSHSMAVDSRRDQSATKAIAVLSLLFLPGSFFTGIFSLPFFDWDQRKPQMIINPRIWIYFTFVGLTTIILFFFWRLWFRFERWRLSHGRHKKIHTDLRTWFKNKMKQREKKKEEAREQKKLKVLREAGPLP